MNIRTLQCLEMGEELVSYARTKYGIKRRRRKERMILHMMRS
jgi:hypothetical protein